LSTTSFLQPPRTTIIDLRRGISSEVREGWKRLQKQNPALQSPYFSPEFTRIVAEARNNVELAVLEDDGKIAGFLPFERHRWKFAGPVGSFISDYHGFICAPNLKFQP